MKRAYKPQGSKLEAFKYRNYILSGEYQNKCKGSDGELFKKQFPTSLHYLYWNSTFWFYHDLLLKSDAQRKGITYEKHWGMGKLVDEAIESCAYRHSIVGDIKATNECKLPDHYILEASRDTFKSTMVRAGLILILGKYPNWTNAYVRANREDAMGGLSWITSHLLMNEDLWYYFKNLKFDPKEIKRRRAKYNRKEITLPMGQLDTENEWETEWIKRTYSPEPNIEAIGLDQAYTGKHKDGFVVIDDAVTEKNYRSKMLQDKMWGRMKEMSNVGSWQCVFVIPQTPYDENDVFERKKRVLRELQEEDDKAKSGVVHCKHYRQPLFYKEGYEPEQLLKFVVAPKDKKELEIGKSGIIFPEWHNVRTIRRKYKECGGDIKFYYSQYLLKIISDQETLFKEEWLVYYGDNTPIGREPPRDDLRIIGLIDPSSSINNSHNDSAGILIVGIDALEYIWVLEAIEDRFTSKGLMDMIVGLNGIYRPNEWYMESYAMANDYRGLIQQILNSGGNRITLMPLKGGTAAGAKISRIESATWPFEMRKVLVQERHKDFLNQYRKYKSPPPAGLEVHLLDLFGYLKNMIYSKSDYDVDYRKPVLNIRTISDMARSEREHIRKQIIKENRNKTVPCMWCLKMNPIASSVCECGGPLYIPTGEKRYAYSDGLVN